jgi:arylsulfatase A-like enzyme
VPPNVLLIVLDTARADALEPYGAAPGTTPALAQFAARGRALPDVHATACWTMPSHAAMFTGLLPRASGVSQAPGETPMSCRPVLESHSDRFLSEVLRRAGFRTRGVSSNIWVSNASGYGTGFDEFRDVTPSRRGSMVSSKAKPRLGWALDAVRARSDDGAGAAGRVLRQWFTDRDERPNFWFVNLIECHSPYLPPKPWNDLSALDRVRAAEEARRHLTVLEIWRVCVAEFDIPDEALERMRQLYDRSIRQLDAWIADTLTALDDAGQLDDTLVLITSDHGENFGEGELLGHAYSLDERLLHVPFIASGSGAPGEMRSLMELPRVIAEAVGLEDHPWPREPVEVAVAQFDSPGEDDDPRKGEMVERWGAGAEALGNLSMTLDAAVRDGTKLVRRDGEFQLFDLRADPLEEHPRVVARSEAPADLVAAIESQSSGPAVAAAAADGKAEDVSAEELARIEEQMRTLGYL